MARKVVTSPDATRALKEARRWLRQPGLGPIRERRWTALRDARRALGRHRHFGVVSREISGHRCLLVSDYRVIYQVSPDTDDEQDAGDIRIVAVLGPGRR